MPLTFTSGDPFLTGQQTLAFGYNSRARAEVNPLADEFNRRYPAAFSAYRKQVKRGRIQPGDLWIWRESTPQLAFMVVRESAVGATRPRYVDAISLRLVRDYRMEGISSLAIAPLGRPHETESMREALGLLLSKTDLNVVVYESYVPGVFGE